MSRISRRRRFEDILVHSQAAGAVKRGISNARSVFVPKEWADHTAMRATAALLVALFALVGGACSSGGSPRPTQTPTHAITAVATLPISPSVVGAPITAAPTVAPAQGPVAAPDLEGALTSAMTGYLAALNAGDFEKARGLLSKCGQQETTVDALRSGRSATGTLTLESISRFERLADGSAQAAVVTNSQFLIGTQSRFSTRSRFVLQDGVWKVGGSAKCGNS